MDNVANRLSFGMAHVDEINQRRVECGQQGRVQRCLRFLVVLRFLEFENPLLREYPVKRGRSEVRNAVFQEINGRQNRFQRALVHLEHLLRLIPMHRETD